MFEKSVFPLYISKGPSKEMTSIGSSILMEYKGTKFLLSAAHVFEEMQGKKSYLYAECKLFEFGGGRTFVSPIHPNYKSREVDPLDLAVLPIPRALEEYIADVNPVTEEAFLAGLSLPSMMYQIIGYPGIKNSNFANKTIRKPGEFYAEFLKYSVHDVGDTAFPHEIYCRAHHIAVCLTTKGYQKETNHRVQLPNLPGISGGLLQRVNNFNPDINDYTDPFPAGMVLGHSKGKMAIYAIRFSTIFEWLELHHEYISQMSA